MIRTWLLAATFFLVLASQWLVTPLGEGLDIYGHLAYATFLDREGRWPTATEPSIRADVATLRAACLGPDYLCPGVYGRWRDSDPAARQAAVRAVEPRPRAPYAASNYQAQHPPLYYVLLSPATRLLRNATLDRQIFWLGLLSIVLATLAMPACHRALRAAVASPAAVLGTLAVAWFPNLMPFLGRVTNDALAFPIAAALVALVATAPGTVWPMALAGVLLGAGLWTKTYFAALAPAILAWAALRRDEHGAWRIDWRSFSACAAPLLVVSGPLLLHNLLATGHLFPLLEARATGALPLGQKLGALFLVDPAWFIAGMARNFVWVGYWSFVSPAYAFYGLVALAVAVPLVVARRRPRTVTTTKAPGRLSPSIVIGGMVLGFLAGMWWHAALFRLDSLSQGLERFSGNEGYYLNVLLPGLALVVTSAVWRGSSTQRTSTLVALVVAMLAANLWARLSMVVFWGGGAAIAGYERLLQWDQALPAVFDAGTWASAFSLPGVVSPALAGALLAGAIALTVVLVVQAVREAP